MIHLVYSGVLSLVWAGAVMSEAPLSFDYSSLSTSYGAPTGHDSFDYSPPSGHYGPPVDTYGPPSHPPQIHKHIYVHVAPPEPDYHHPPQIIHPPEPKKHYKIVFIKAPTPPTPPPPIIPEIPQDEEKTLIYVLVKRPEEAPPISIPTVKPTLPTKPEVYFIRYKTQKKTTAVGTKTQAYGPPAPRPVYGI